MSIADFFDFSLFRRPPPPPKPSRDNSYRGSLPTIEVPKPVEMAAYDRLPPMVRKALGYAPGPFSARECLDMIEGGVPPASVIGSIEQAAMQEYGRRHDGWRGKRIRRRRSMLR